MKKTLIALLTLLPLFATAEVTISASPMELLDENGSVIEGVTKSTSREKLMEKASKQGNGVYKGRSDITITVTGQGGVVEPPVEPVPCGEGFTGFEPDCVPIVIDPPLVCDEGYELNGTGDDCILIPVEPPMPPMGNMPPVDSSFNMAKDNGSGTKDIRPTTYQPTGVGRNTGEFRIQCQPTFMAQIDPIVNFGTTSMHHHTFFGNTAVTSTSTNETLSSTGNSTCFGGTANRSSYWIPSLIDTLNGGKPLKPTWGLFYYKTGKVNTVIAPPVGLRIIAGKATGNPNAPQGSASWDQQEVVRWSCNDRYINNNQPSIPACSGKLSLLIAFPSCWDGRLDSPDHASHMAYSVNGVCPATHQAGQIADITFNVHWENLPNTNGLRLATDNYVGNAGGFSAHADWMNGWDEDVVQTITQKCLREGRDCHANLMGNGNELFRNF